MNTFHRPAIVTCKWCGAEVRVLRRGAVPRYCSPRHRTRAYRHRLAEEEAARLRHPTAHVRPALT